MNLTELELRAALKRAHEQVGAIQRDLDKAIEELKVLRRIAGAFFEDGRYDSFFCDHCGSNVYGGEEHLQDCAWREWKAITEPEGETK